MLLFSFQLFSTLPPIENVSSHWVAFYLLNSQQLKQCLHWSQQLPTEWILCKWVAISFSRGSSWPRDGTWVSHMAARFFTIWSTREVPYLLVPWLISGLPWWLRQKRICLQFIRPRFDPWIGRIAWRRTWQLTPVFLPGEFHGQRNLVDCSLWDCKELDMTEQLTLSLWLILPMRESRLRNDKQKSPTGYKSNDNTYSVLAWGTILKIVLELSQIDLINTQVHMLLLYQLQASN